MRTGALLALLALSGCASLDRDFQELDPGADRVVLTQNPADVAGLELLGTSDCQLGGMWPRDHAWIWARNVVHRAGGEVGLVTTEPIPNGPYPAGTSLTVTAYDRP